MMKAKHLYIHIPFCKSICYYCDFCHVIYKKELADKVLKKIIDDLKQYDIHQFETIYIGGGTPSVLSYEQLNSLLSALKPFCKNAKEVTMEVNPETVDDKKIKLLKDNYINRVSIGLQSASLRLLQLMGRKHNYEDVVMLVSKLKAVGIDNISVDIIYSLPTQTIEDLKDTLDKVLNLDVKHISLYSLTIEENTVFYVKHYSNLEEDIEADMYEIIEKTLTNNGYKHYEVANFAHDGYESKHNMGYWRYDDFIGIGPGASGKEGLNRYTYTGKIIDYINNHNLFSEEILLDKKEAQFENIMMSFRTSEGLDITKFNNQYDADFQKEYNKALSLNSNNLIIENDHCICKNLNILNSVLVDFIDYK